METKKDDKLDSSLKTIVKSSLFVFIFLLFSRIIFYFYRIIIARNFGPGIYGTFSLSIAIFSFAVTISALGFSEGILRFIPFYRGKNKIKNIRHILRWSLILLTISSVLFGFILFFSSEFISINIFHDADLIIFLKVLSFAFPFYSLGSALLCFIRGFEKAKEHSFISEFLQNGIKLIFLIIFVAMGIKEKSIVFSHFAGILAVFVIAYLYCRYKLPEIFKKSMLSKKTKKQIGRKFFLYSLPLIFSGMLYILFGYTDSVLIGIFKTSTDVGFYNAALPIATFMTFLPILFLQIFFPMITREFSEKRFKIVHQLSKQVQKWIFIINLPVFLLMFLFSGAFINLLFGAEYMVAEQTLRILSIGLFFYSMTQISENLILAIGKSKILFINIISLLVLNLVLNLILIPKYGIEGAAWSVTISYILLYFIMLFQVKHYINLIPLKRKMLLVFISAIIPLFVLMYIKQFIEINLVSILLLGILFFLLYSLLIFLTKSFDENDLTIIRAIREKSFLRKSKRL